MTPNRVRVTTALITAAVLFAAGGAATPAQAAFTVGFDDLTGGVGGFSNPYAGLDWSGIGYIDIVGLGWQGNGYGEALSSGTTIGYTADTTTGFSSSILFTFNSGHFSSGFNDGLTVEVQGLKGGTQLYTQTLVLDTTSQTFATFDFAGIDQVKFVVTAPGTLASGLPYGGSGAQFGMDDLTFDSSVAQATPAPPSLLVALSGVASLGGFGWLRRRRLVAAA